MRAKFAAALRGYLASAGVVCSLLIASSGMGDAAERVSVGVGGKTIIAYLAVSIAELKGYFRDEGLDVQINDFKGGPKAIEALIGGSVDMAVASHEYPLLLQPKKVDLTTVTLLTTSYGNVFGIRKSLAASYRSPKDLKGLNIGVTSPGSMLAGVVGRILAKDDLTINDVSIIGIGAGAGAIALVKSGRIDAISHADPVISHLVWDDAIVPLIDARTSEGMRYIFGGEIAASVVITTPSFIGKNKKTVQKFVAAVVRAQQWMREAKPEEIIDVLPSEYYNGDRDSYRRMLVANRGIFSSDGLVRAEQAQRTLDFLVANGSREPGSHEDLVKTFDNSFVESALTSQGKRR